MECTTVIRLINAWIDRQRGPEEHQGVADHIARCAACRQEVRDLQKIVEALDTLRPVRPPRGFSARTVRAFRTAAERPGFKLWWQNLSFAMRGAACATVLAGLLFGAVLGTSIATLDNSAGDPYQTLYVSQGILP